MTLDLFGQELLEKADADSRQRSVCHPDWLRWTAAAIALTIRELGPEACIDRDRDFCVRVIMELQAAQRQNVIPLSDEITSTWMKFAHGITYAAIRWLCDVGHRDGALIEGMASEATLILRPTLSHAE